MCRWFSKPCRIRSAWPIRVSDGTSEVAVQSLDANLYEFTTAAGQTYTLSAFLP